MDFIFDLQCFGGGGSSTTVQERNIPAETADEAALRQGLDQYNQHGLDLAGKYVDKANDYINKSYNPDWASVIKNYDSKTGQLQDDFKNNGQQYLDAYTKAQQDALAKQEGAVNGNIGDYKTGIQGLIDKYTGSQTQNTTEYKDKLANIADAYKQGYAAATTTFNDASKSALGDYTAAMSDAQSRYNSLADGILPSNYATARQNAIKDDMTATMGNSISDLARRGILNSSITDSAMNDISQNISDTLAKNYTSDLASAANLNGLAANNATNTYNTRYGNAKDLYNAATGLADKTYGADTSTADKSYAATSTDNNNLLKLGQDYQNNVLAAANAQANQAYANTTGAANNAYQAQNAYATNLLNSGLNQEQTALRDKLVAQTASWAPAGLLMGYAQQLGGSAQNQWANMYNGRMGAASTTSTTTSSDDGKGGLWGGIGQIGAAAITKGVIK